MTTNQGEFLDHLESYKMALRESITQQEAKINSSRVKLTDERGLLLCWVKEYDLISWRMREEEELTMQYEQEVPF